MTEADQPEEPGNDAEPERDPGPAEYPPLERPEPTRYGDWEKGGRCIDF